MTAILGFYLLFSLVTAIVSHLYILSPVYTHIKSNKKNYDSISNSLNITRITMFIMSGLFAPIVFLIYMSEKYTLMFQDHLIDQLKDTGV